jgi:hypothetical protein
VHGRRSGTVPERLDTHCDEFIAQGLLREVACPDEPLRAATVQGDPH